MPNRTCSVEGCAARVKAHGLCNRHYLRLRKNGDPLKVQKNIARANRHRREQNA